MSKKRTFTVTFTEEDDGTISACGENNGFTGKDLVYMLGMKLGDICNQIIDPDRFIFERVFKDENGDVVIKKEKNNA